MDHPARRRTHRPSRPHPLRRPRRRTRPRQSGPRPRRRARLAACDLRAEKQRHAHRSVRKRRPVRRRALVGDAQRRRCRVSVAARLVPRHPHRLEQGNARQSASRASGPHRRQRAPRPPGRQPHWRENPRPNPRPHTHRPTRRSRARRRRNRTHARVAALAHGCAHPRRDHGHRRRVLQRLLRRALRVCARRRHLRRAQPTPTPRPAQRRPVLRVRDPPVRMRRRAPRSRARAVTRHRARAHRQTPQPGAGPHGTVPPTPGGPDRHGAAAHVQAPARTRRRRGQGRGVWLGGDGKKILVDAYEAASQRSVTGALPGFSGSWRRHIAHSAQMLARAIAEPDYQSSGVAWR